MKQCPECGFLWQQPPEECPQCRFLLLQEALHHEHSILTTLPSSEENPPEHRCKLCGITLADEEIYCFSCGEYDGSRVNTLSHVAASLLTPQQRRDILVEQFHRWSHWIVIVSIFSAIVVFYIGRSFASDQAAHAFQQGLINGSIPRDVTIVIFLHSVGAMIGGLFLALLVRGGGELLRTLGGIEDKLK
jgi:hypothetical protein